MHRCTSACTPDRSTPFALHGLHLGVPRGCKRERPRDRRDRAGSVDVERRRGWHRRWRAWVAPPALADTCRRGPVARASPAAARSAPVYTLAVTSDPRQTRRAEAAAGPRLLALLDYDGTMTTHECNEVALQPFVGDRWWELEEESYNDRMSHAEVFDRQIGLIEAPRAELIRRLLEVAEPMPGLRDFFTELRARGGECAIVSAGIREAIEAFWEREQLPPMELFASELVGDGPGRRAAVPPRVQRGARRLPALRAQELQGGDPAQAAPPRRRRPRVRRRAQRPLPRARGRPRVRARSPRGALRRRGTRVAAAHGLRRRARRGGRVAGAPVSATRRRGRDGREAPAGCAEPALLGRSAAGRDAADRRRRGLLPGGRVGVPDLAAARGRALVPLLRRLRHRCLS